MYDIIINDVITFYLIQPKACEEANSYDITTKTISSCSSDLQYLFKKLKEEREAVMDGKYNC